MKSNTKQFPKNKIAWLWENMEGKRALYFVGILGTVLYNILQLTIPYFSGKIVDLFLTGENAATNLQVTCFTACCLRWSALRSCVLSLFMAAV